VGTVVGPVLGSYAFFKNTGDSVGSLKNVQWTYLAIAIFVFSLAVVFYFSTLPEITDADMAYQASETHIGQADKSFWKQYTLFHAAFAQFCYVGSQGPFSFPITKFFSLTILLIVAIAGYFINYVTETRSHTDSALGAKFLAGAQGCFAVGRFSGSFLMKFVKPRWVFGFYLTCVIIFNSASITQRQNTGLAMLMITLFFESVCFPTIVALGIRGLGRHTKRGSGWIVGGVAGGACVPPLLGAAADIHNSTAFAMIVPVMFFVAAWTYAAAVNFVPLYVEAADKIGMSDIGVRNAGGSEEHHSEDGSAGFSGSEEKSTPVESERAHVREEKMQ
jgi:MFS transporter, FHS family, L-fucose permease